MIKMQRSSAHTDYLIFENISNINYYTKPIDVPKFGDLDITKTQFWYNGESTEINRIDCLRDGKNFTFYFDGEAFICTDEGKTVQKIPSL